MANFCACDITFGNTGKANCEPIQSVTRKLFFVNTYGDDGVRNSIDLSVPIDQAYLTARLNDTDKSKRWYPTRPLVAVTDERGDPVTESIDGMDYITDDAPRLFVGQSVKTDAVYLGKIKNGQCGDFSVFAIDKNNKIIGEISEDETLLYPLKIEQGTYYASLIKTTSTTVQKTQIAFAYAKELADQDLRLATATADLIGANGLLDVNAVITNPTTTGFEAALTIAYGYANAPTKVKGWLVTDFVLYNVTQAAAVVITSVTEAPEGFYTFVIPAATAGDVLLLTQANPAKDGFELSVNVNVPV